VAAILESRHYIGFEIDKSYYDIAQQRIIEIKNEKI
jgi:DNA modification methylase